MTFPSHLQYLNGSLSKSLRSLKVYFCAVYCQGPNALVGHHMSETLARSSSKSGQEIQALVPQSTVNTGPKFPAISERALQQFQRYYKKTGRKSRVCLPLLPQPSFHKPILLSQISMTKITESSLGSLFQNVVFNNSTITVDVHQKKD